MRHINNLIDEIPLPFDSETVVKIDSNIRKGLISLNLCDTTMYSTSMNVLEEKVNYIIDIIRNLVASEFFILRRNSLITEVLRKLEFNSWSQDLISLKSARKVVNSIIMYLLHSKFLCFDITLGSRADEVFPVSFIYSPRNRKKVIHITNEIIKIGERYGTLNKFNLEEIGYIALPRRLYKNELIILLRHLEYRGFLDVEKTKGKFYRAYFLS